MFFSVLLGFISRQKLEKRTESSIFRTEKNVMYQTEKNGVPNPASFKGQYYNLKRTNCMKTLKVSFTGLLKVKANSVNSSLFSPKNLQILVEQHGLFIIVLLRTPEKNPGRRFGKTHLGIIIIYICTYSMYLPHIESGTEE